MDLRYERLKYMVADDDEGSRGAVCVYIGSVLYIHGMTCPGVGHRILFYSMNRYRMRRVRECAPKHCKIICRQRGVSY